MKTIGLLVVAAILLTNQVSAVGRENQFIRKPGQYSLDAKGSMLTITQASAGFWLLKATWRSGDAASSAAPEDCLRTNGWFVFVENPGRIWIFDGKNGGILLSNSERDTTVSSFSQDVMTSCPQKVWDALPEGVREKYRKVVPAATAKRSQPGSPDTNRTPPAAGSGR